LDVFGRKGGHLNVNWNLVDRIICKVKSSFIL